MSDASPLDTGSLGGNVEFKLPSGKTVVTDTEWKMTTGKGTTTHSVVVKSGDNLSGDEYESLLEIKFKGVSKEEQITQMLAVKAMRSLIKSVNAVNPERAESIIKKIQEGGQPKFYKVYNKDEKDPQKSIQDVVLVWPGKNPGDPPYTIDPKTGTKWLLDGAIGSPEFKRDLAVKSSGGFVEELDLSFKQKVVNLFKRNKPRSSERLGYRVTTEASATKAQQKAGLGLHAVTGIKGGRKTGPAKTIVEHTAQLWEKWYKANKKEGELRAAEPPTGPIVGTIAPPERKLVVTAEVKDESALSSEERSTAEDAHLAAHVTTVKTAAAATSALDAVAAFSSASSVPSTGTPP